MKTIEEAIILAAMFHQGQLDKYINDFKIKFSL